MARKTLKGISEQEYKRLTKCIRDQQQDEERIIHNTQEDREEKKHISHAERCDNTRKLAAKSIGVFLGPKRITQM